MLGMVLMDASRARLSAIACSAVAASRMGAMMKLFTMTMPIKIATPTMTIAMTRWMRGMLAGLVRGVPSR